MLDGQGADELLGGYSMYLATCLVGLIRQGALVEAMCFGRRASALPHVRARRLLLATGGALLPTWLRPVGRRLIGEDLAPAWLNAKWFEGQGVRITERNRRRSDDTLQHHMYESLENGLQALLRYEDRNSMAHSIESRVPFLTPQLARFIYSLPQVARYME